MGVETEFGEKLARRLRGVIRSRYHVETKRSLLYAVSFDDSGNLHLGQDHAREPIRGGGTGFEQDLLLFERSETGTTSIIPRVSVELKFGHITTHDAIVYSEKARRIRTIYPYVRYGLILGGLSVIPPRTLRLGTEFDFVVALPERFTERVMTPLVRLLRKELRLSKSMTDILRGRKRIAILHRDLRHGS